MWTSRYSTVVKATRNGSLPKARDMKCEKCGDQASQRHHEDYSKPLEVIYLCFACHIARHKELGWGTGGRGKLDAWAALQKLQPFDFAIFDDVTIHQLSPIAHVLGKAGIARFKCFTCDEAVVAFRLPNKNTNGSAK